MDFLSGSAFTIGGVPLTQYIWTSYSTTTSSSGTSGTGSGGGSTPAPVPPDQISTVTGIDPQEVANATMGKVIPIWVGGMPRMGSHIIYGPTIRFVSGVPRASFGVSFGMPANNLGTRELREIRLDGFKVWTLAEGSLIPDFTHRFYGGTETQAADPLVIAAFPGAPVAHKGQCCIFIEELPLTDFNNQVPFVSALIADTTGAADPEDGVNLGDALEQIAASPYVDIDFESVDISERVDAVIVAEKIAFIDLCVRYSRLHLWDVVQRDKLKVIERGTVTPDLTLDLTNILADTGDNAPITIERQQQDDLARELEYSYIDIDRDYEINSISAIRPNAPVPVTVSAGKDTVALPSVHTVQEAISWATLRLYKDEVARDRLSFTASIYGFEIEPGDVISVDAGFKTYIVRVLETLHGANWTNRIVGEPVLRCAVPVSSAPLDGIACVTGAWSLSRTLLSTFTGQRYEAVSTAVSRISDQTIGARHFADLGGSTTRPALTTAGANSRTCADFDGSNDYLDTGSDLSNFITEGASYAIISCIVDAVTLGDPSASNNHALIGDASQKWGIYAANGPTIYGFNWDGNSDQPAVGSDDGLATAIALVIALRHESGNLYVDVNGSNQVSVASGNTSLLTGDLRVGMSAASTNANFKLFEAATFNCVPNEGTREGLIDNFMDWVGAVALEPPAPDLNLPGGAFSRIGAQARLSVDTSGPSSSTTVETATSFDQEVFDTNGFFTPTSTKIVIPAGFDGRLGILYAICWLTYGTFGDAVWTIKKNGSANFPGAGQTSQTSMYTFGNLGFVQTNPVILQQGDEYEVYQVANSVTNTNESDYWTFSLWLVG